MIIDIHTHTGMRRGWPRTFIQEAQRLGITRLCLLGDWDFDAPPEHIKAANDRTMRLVRRRPDVFVGFCFLNPNHDEKFALGEISRCVEKGNLRGVKLEVETNARSKRLDPIMRACADLGVPVLHHAWYKTVGKVLNESSPADIADLARRHPRTTIIMAHLTAAGIRGVLDIRPYPNIYVDTSGSQPFSGIIEYAVAALGARRILYGSDANGRDFSCQLGRVYAAKISRRDRELILGLNAQRLLGL
jgi:uncharacterized protein